MRRIAALLLASLCFALAFAAPPGGAWADEPLPEIDHTIAATVDPEAHGIEVIDEITLPPRDTYRFRVHGNLSVEALEGSAYTVHAVETPAAQGGTGGGEEGSGHALWLRTWELRRTAPAADRPLAARLRLAGTIHHPLETESQEYARSFSRTPGTIDAGGVFLGGASWWVPRFGDELVTFTLTVHLPEGWDAVSQGARAAAHTEDGRRTVVWSCKHPMDEIYLIAARFHEYDGAAGAVRTYAFLREPDETLAGKYLEVTAQYIEMYRQLIGRYPFSKFALIENFWETGYGMPSFTLLGPRVIRFPFILHSSYPHEILHNWWGNSVYVDWETGNWCEGLTAYLADHLIRESQGRGEEYRQDTLKSYRDYVKGARDFPLTQFRSRHSAATQAIGYGKCLMLFHMLRRELGDAVFTRCLQQFYRKHQFTRASFDDIRISFGETAERDLTGFFDTWVQRTGAPELELEVKFAGQGTLVVEVRQVQGGQPYPLSVPLAVTLEGQAEAHVVTVQLDGAVKQIALQVPGKPLRVDLDPQFDVFRRLHRAEIPATLSQMFGAEHVTLVVPDEDAHFAAAWRVFAQTWQGGGDDVQVVAASALAALPADRAVWVLGADNPWKKALAPVLEAQGAGVRDDVVDFGAVEVPRRGHSFVYVVPHPGNDELAVGWVGSDVEAALPGLARKLPHYGKYSHLGFQGEAPDNVAKGRWSATGSPLSVLVQGAALGTSAGTLPARTPLARLAPVFDTERMMRHVRWLAAPEREGRGVGTHGLDESADYIADLMKHAGLQPGGDDGTFFQTFTAENGPDGKPVVLRNVVGVLPGANPAWKDQSVVLGAHYDHLGRGWPDQREASQGEIYNGADDNASGIAVLLEVAALLGKQHKPARSLVFAAFTGEEWGLKGSQHYVSAMQRWPAKQALAMVNLDTVGRLGGKKLQVLGSGTATEWRHIAMGIGFTTGVESQCIAEDPGGSDQQSFVRAGVPAVQIFSGIHGDYHRPSDDVEKIDAEGLVQVATFVREAIVYLGDRPEPLTSTLKPDEPPEAAKKGEGRRVSFGTMPAFDYRGEGVKVADVVEGSPAAKAGIEKGDILLMLDGEPMKDLRAFSQMLRRRSAGDTVRVTLRRGEAERSVDVTLVAR